jgi:hypothetical protein
MMLAQQPIDELGGRTQSRLGRLAVGSMPRVRQQGDLDRAVALLLRHLDLPQRAILIVFTLHDQDRNPDVGEFIVKLPFAEFGIEPGPAPGVERVIGIGMPARELGA